MPTNFGNGARFTGSEWFIAEGDEYDTAFFDKRSKFVHYLPEVAIINNIEFDHADIFEHLGAVQASFRQFVNLIPRNGLLLANGDDPNITAVVERSFAPVAHSASVRTPTSAQLTWMSPAIARSSPWAGPGFR